MVSDAPYHTGFSSAVVPHDQVIAVIPLAGGEHLFNRRGHFRSLREVSVVDAIDGYGSFGEGTTKCLKVLLSPWYAIAMSVAEMTIIEAALTCLAVMANDLIGCSFFRNEPPLRKVRWMGNMGTVEACSVEGVCGEYIFGYSQVFSGVNRTEGSGVAEGFVG